MFWNHVCYDTNFVDLYKYLLLQWRTFVTRVQIPHKVLELVITLIFYLNCKCRILHNCIIDLYARNLKPKHLYNLGDCFCSLRSVGKNHKLPLPIQTLCQIFTSVVGFRDMHYTVFLGQVRHMGTTSHTCPCHWCYKLKKKKRNPTSTHTLRASIFLWL